MAEKKSGEIIEKREEKTGSPIAPKVQVVVKKL